MQKGGKQDVLKWINELPWLLRNLEEAGETIEETVRREVMEDD